MAREARSGPALDGVLESPPASRQGRAAGRCGVRYQQVLEYGSDQVERKLRSVMQHHRQVGYLFLGSRKHLIQKMVLDRNRPLYRAGGHYPLGPIAEVHWQPFVRQRFAGRIKASTRATSTNYAS